MSTIRPSRAARSGANWNQFKLLSPNPVAWPCSPSAASGLVAMPGGYGNRRRKRLPFRLGIGAPPYSHPSIDPGILVSSEIVMNKFLRLGAHALLMLAASGMTLGSARADTIQIDDLGDGVPIVTSSNPNANIT